MRLRARLLAQTRRFFAERGVLEVETPLLSAAAASDLHLANIPCQPVAGAKRRYLQTSPEYAMKRLLAAGSGPIYQITRAFRDDEVGRFHNPEFTLLEWYRPGFDHQRLMDEMDVYLGALLGTQPARRRAYAEVFGEAVGLDPHRSTARELAARARELGLDEMPGLDRDGWLQRLLAERAEPDLGRGRPAFLYDFPASQAALARLRRDDPDAPPVAERFEVYVEGVELANGFSELTDAAEQRGRFEADLERRRAAGLPAVPLDERFLAALEAGLPPCAGVALGFDRLVMLAAGAASLAEVLAFPWDRA